MNSENTNTLCAGKRQRSITKGLIMKKIASITLAVATAMTAFPASAQFAKAEDAVKYRKNALFVMQQNFARVAGMAAGKIPFDAKVAADSAVTAEFVGKLPWAAFSAGTDQGDTKAKPEIWAQKAKFDDYAGKMQAEMAKLATAAKSGNLDNIKLAVNATGSTCKSCHDDFRAK
jgi:cytochrome c556